MAMLNALQLEIANAWCLGLLKLLCLGIAIVLALLGWLMLVMMLALPHLLPLLGIVNAWWQLLLPLLHALLLSLLPLLCLALLAQLFLWLALALLAKVGVQRPVL